MSKPVVIENPELLEAFKNIQEGMSCAISVELTRIAVGEMIYAKNADEARNGMGICEAEYLKLTGKADAPKVDDPDPNGDPDPKDDGKSPAGKGKGGK